MVVQEQGEVDIGEVGDVEEIISRCEVVSVEEGGPRQGLALDPTPTPCGEGV